MTLGRQLTNPTCSLKKPAECLSLVHIIRVKCQAFCFSASKYANKYQAKPLGYKVSQFAELMISTHKIQLSEYAVNPLCFPSESL